MLFSSMERCRSRKAEKSGMPFLAGQDGNGIGEKDLGIGDDAGKEDGMGRSTMGAFDPTYAQPETGCYPTLTVRK